MQKVLDPQQSLDLGAELDKKVITEDNFEEVFKYWDSIFHNSVENGMKSSRYFVRDIQAGKSEYSEMRGGVNFYINDDGKTVFKTILKKDYDNFWGIYEKINNPAEISGILAKIDRLADDTLRRFEGQFFTPLDFAKKGLEYLEKVLGKKWYKEYKVWDMCAGTGNLEYFYPSEYLHNVYVSTIAEDEVEHLRKVFWTIPENVFQYDYLNDDVDLLFADEEQIFAKLFDGKWKLPKKLRDDLANPANKWVILINPPYATSGNHVNSENAKIEVNKTKIRGKMHEQNLGNASEELFSQFLFRIEKEFRDKNSFLGMYSKIKYINSPANAKFREKTFNFVFKKGFIFNSLNFTGNKGSFPVGFLIWDLLKRKELVKQKIIVDVFESIIKSKQMIRGTAVKIGQKYIKSEDKNLLLNKWFKRPKSEKLFAPFSSAIKEYSGKVRVDKLSKDGFGYMRSTSNDLQNQNYTFFMSTAYGHGDGWSIEDVNFEKTMIINAVRRIPKATWINDRDQFMQPTEEISREFENDCVVWSLFSGSNQTSSLKDVEYKGKIYQIKNEFFPFPSAEVLKWEITNPDIKNQIPAKNRFVSDWIRKADLSPESREILEIRKKIYQEFYKKFNELDRTKYKLKTWDAGWWQIRMSLADQDFAESLFKEMKEAYKKLKEKILPQIYEFGFLGEEKVPK